MNFPLNGDSEVVVMPWSKSSVMRVVSAFLSSLSMYVPCPLRPLPRRAGAGGVGAALLSVAAVASSNRGAAS